MMHEFYGQTDKVRQHWYIAVVYNVFLESALGDEITDLLFSWHNR